MFRKIMNRRIKVVILALLTAFICAIAVSVCAQESPGVITGRATDEAGDPITNALVRVSVRCGICPWTAVERHSADTRTDVNGSFGFEIPSDYLAESYVKIEVFVEAEGYGKVIQNVDLKPGQTSTVNLVLEKGEKEVTEENEILVLPISVGLLSMIGVVIIHAMKLEETIKRALIDKSSGTAGVISFAVMAAVYLFLHSITDGIGPSTIFLTTIISLLIGTVFALFVYGVKRCGIRAKEGGVGFVGIVIAVISCVGCVLAAFVGVGTALILAQYGSVFTISAIGLLFASTILLARNIKKEECRVCRQNQTTNKD